MIEINLLPAELRKKKKKKVPSFEFSFNKKIPLVVFGGLVLFHLLFISLNTVTKIRLKSLKNNWQGISLKREKLNQIKAELKEVNAKIPLIEQLMRDRILWSRKLNQISELAVPGVWLNELSLEIKEEALPRPIARTKVKTPAAKPKVLKYLIIEGSCASRGKDEPALIGRFMQNLKSDASFSSDFTGIELGPIKERRIEQIEVMDFILTGRFKK